MNVVIYIQNEDGSFKGQLDGLTDGFGLGLQKSVVSSDNIGKRGTMHSFTTTHLGTKNNNYVFSHLFDAAVEVQEDGQFLPEFNPRRKAFVKVLSGPDVLLDGFIKLETITKDKDSRVVYNVTYYAKELDIFTAVGDAYLSDLDLSEFNHEYTNTNIVASWNSSIVVSGSTVAFELGRGYVYPMIEYGEIGALPKPENWYWNHFKPAIYAKQYLDKIFESIGYSYESDFFNSERFKRLIIPFTNGEFKLSTEEVAERGFTSTRGAVADLRPVDTSTSGTQVIPFDVEVSDPGGVYNSTTGIFTAPANGYYSFGVRIKGRYQYIGSTTFLSPLSRTIEVVKDDGVNKTSIGGVIAGDQWTLVPQPVNNGDYSDGFDVSLNIGYTFFNAGETAYVHAVRTGSSGVDLNIETQEDSYFTEATNPAFDYGGTISINSAIPIKYKQSEFIQDLMRLFNLYYEVSTESENTILFEPRNDGFYTSEAMNLENKLNIDAEHTITPNEFSQFKTYRFTYSEDSDYYNKLYKDTYNEVYGQQQVDINNDFKASVNEIKTNLAATPLIGQPQASPVCNRVISSIEFVDGSGNPVPTAGKPRMLYYAMKTGDITWNLWDNAGVNSGPYLVYPYAGHVDDPFNPVFDLNFGLPKAIYWQSVGSDIVNLTNQTLYYLYWYIAVREIEDSNARGFGGFFEISFHEFTLLSFRKLYYFQKLYWRLLEIVDFECTRPRLTRLRFIKALDIPAITAVTGEANGGGGTFGDGEYKIPTTYTPTYTYDNNYNPNAGVGTGTGNIIQGPATNRNTILGGTGNYIPDGLTGVTLINTTGYTAEQSDINVLSGTTYIEGDTEFNAPATFNAGVNIGSDTLADYINSLITGAAGTLVNESTDYSVVAGVNTVIADASAGNMTILLPASPVTNYPITIQRVDNTGNTLTVDGNGKMINGVGSAAIIGQYTKITLIYNGTEWFK